MKKSQMLLKPLVAAVAVASGTLVLHANALPTMPSSKTVVESICHAEVEATISGGVRFVDTGVAACQERSLPVTKGLVLVDGAIAAEQTTENLDAVAAGVYTTQAGGSLVLTQNNALSVSSTVTANTGVKSPLLSYDLTTAVQPAQGLTNADLDGTYTVVTRNSAWAMVAAGIEQSPYAQPNFALGFYNNYTNAADIRFNGDGSCEVVDLNDRMNITLRKDPLGSAGVPVVGEDCDPAEGLCAQIGGQNYEMMASLNLGLHSNFMAMPEFTSAALEDQSCTYEIEGEKVVLDYTIGDGAKNTKLDLYVSADKRYLVNDAQGSTASVAQLGVEIPGGIALAVRQGESADVAGKTYAVNMLTGVSNLSSGVNEALENPYTPEAQTVQCLSRGQLTFAADGTCQLQSLAACQSRYLGGLEESEADAGDGTIFDRFAVDVADANSEVCQWTATGSKLDVAITVNGQTSDYVLTVADNGQALVGLGGESVEAQGSPDEQNPPALTPEASVVSTYVVGQQLAEPLSSEELEQLAAVELISSGAAKSDFNGDGKADLFLRNASGKSQVWVMDGTTLTQRLDYNFIDPNSEIVAIHDFDSNGYSDVLLRNNTNGALHIVTSDENGCGQTKLLGHNAASNKFVGLADIDGSGNKSIVMQGQNGRLFAIPLNGTDRAGNVVELGFVEATTQVASIADVDGNGTDDLVMQGSAGSIFVIHTDAGARSGQTVMANNAPLKVKLAADLNGDGMADLVAIHPTTGRTIIMQTKAAVASQRPYDPIELGMYPGAEVLAAGEFGNGAEVVLRSAAGDLVVASGTGSRVVGSVAANFSYVGAVDLNGDGQLDLVFEDQAAKTHHIVLFADGEVSEAQTLANLSRENKTYVAK